MSFSLGGYAENIKRKTRRKITSVLGNKNDKQDDLDFPQYSHKPDHDDVNGCSACGLLSSLDYLRRHRLLCDVIFQVQSQVSIELNSNALS